MEELDAKISTTNSGTVKDVALLDSTTYNYKVDYDIDTADHIA
ncbi:MAG: hypothetical protein QM532_03940 [Cyanobium sp. MAG06]|nr:hypothetical protein [Cyanobium sp. MAG06]